MNTWWDKDNDFYGKVSKNIMKTIFILIIIENNHF